MIRLTLHQSRYDLLAFVRNRQSQFFTLALPVLFLVIFASVFGGQGQTTQVPGGRISTSVYYVPGIMALGIIAACFGNLVASVTAQRERAQTGKGPGRAGCPRPSSFRALTPPAETFFNKMHPDTGSSTRSRLIHT